MLNIKSGPNGHIMSKPRSGEESRPELRSPFFQRLLHVGRQSGVGLFSGLIAGVLIGGLGSRIAMRLSALAGGDSILGMVTENGNVVGNITVDGTLLLIYAGGLAGAIGGFVYMAWRRWIPGPPRWRGLVYGVILLSIFGRLVIEGDNPDFVRFGPPVLNIIMFASLFIFYGLLLVPLAEWFNRSFPVASTRRVLTLIAYGVLAIPPLLPIGGIIILLLPEQVDILTRVHVLLILSLYGLAFVPTVDGSNRSILARSKRPALTFMGYVLMAAPLLVGLILIVDAIMAILRAAG